jgi:hypothetical protein
VDVPGGKTIETAHYLLAIDWKTGAITRLLNKATGREWAGPNNPLALFTYQTLSQEDYKHYIDVYSQCHDEWVAHDFGKPNIEKFGAVSRDWHPDVAAVADGGDGSGSPDRGEDADQGRGVVSIGRCGFSAGDFLRVEAAEGGGCDSSVHVEL